MEQKERALGLVVRYPEVEKVTGLSLATILRLEKAGDFPPRRRLSGRARGWIRAEVMGWVASREKIGG